MALSGDSKPVIKTGMNRRQLLGTGICLFTGASLLFSRTAKGVPPVEWSSPSNGSSDPVPIPWLDKNGSHNQSPGPGMEPSNIYHFKGHAARCNAFTGVGTDNQGNRISFGAPSTDFSFLEGKYFAGRQERAGTFSHI
ncbi:MAG: hypothetical protein ACYDHW_13205 [Syntrophorhabdaceae bacterium]